MTSTHLTRNERNIIITLIFGTILPLLDSTLINLALENISLDLATPLAVSQWAILIYVLTATVFTPVSAWLGDKFGFKRLWLGSLWLFFLASVLAGLAFEITMLLIARALQGAATGLLLPTMQTLLVQAVGRDKTRLALTMMSVPTVLVPIFAPLLAGAILSIAQWQWLFWLPLPIAVMAIILSQIYLPSEQIKMQKSFDLIGFLILTPSLALLCYSALQGITERQNMMFAVLAIGLLCWFILHAQRLGQQALVQIHLLKNRPFCRAISLLGLASMLYYGGILFYPLFLSTQGFSHFQIGVLLAFHGIGTLLARQKLTKLSEKYHDQQLLLFFSGLILLSSLAIACFSCSFMALAGLLAVRGAGSGVLTIIPMSNAYQTLPPESTAQASLISRMIPHFGATFGVAIVGMAGITGGHWMMVGLVLVVWAVSFWGRK